MAPADFAHRTDDLHQSVQTTYYSLVGLHAFHVTVGLAMLGIVLLCVWPGVSVAQSARVNCLDVLAFRGRRVGRCVTVVRHWPLRSRRQPSKSCTNGMAARSALDHLGFRGSAHQRVGHRPWRCAGWGRVCGLVPGMPPRPSSRADRARGPQVATARRVVERLAVAPSRCAPGSPCARIRSRPG